ncbi:L-type lectin-domain containing receptor kinase IX.1-like [Zingiber officinale]|uniref:non-specific serine/threonine protein kinase n=1 Tax=Zingiber officinale TaxID=94328 RepID=A0A8J5CF03_ZINOF|nr:L-type lectin-domain containing receptor kinase IX.1-like [Zingiber officinale]KAG6473174.1 hypothetical protein ZIOFF_067083 [Zingiber officinale]
MQSESRIISATVLLFISIPMACSLSFNLSSFNPQENLVINQNDAILNGSKIDLTRYPMQYATGRVEYGDPLVLWSSATGNLTDFTTQFTFVVNSFNGSEYADGIAFFLSPYNYSRPPYSSGGFLGLFTNSSLAAVNSTVVTVAVEFDTFANAWDPEGDHIGIDVDSIVSRVTAPWNADAGIRAGRAATARVSYDSTTRNLSVLVSYDSGRASSASLSLIVDLREILPEKVGIGFSATTGNLTETHSLLSWSFHSTLQLPLVQSGGSKQPAAAIAGGAAAGTVALISLAAALIWWWKRKRPDINIPLNVRFAREAGPREFPYEVLAAAASNFSGEVKLGGGGFGSVYRGQLDGRDVAIKKVSLESEQGITEYISEVTIISRLRHCNLVELVGWCHRHEREQYLLVYEFMPHGSLDKHLYDAGECMPWPRRLHVALGLAAALRYLHHECKPSVVHRDVKPSNVMLDSEFNAKLGDFGLARLLDDDGDQRQATKLAGTRPYMAPEYYYDGEFSSKTDVYSFGIVALDIACGRRPREIEKMLVEWVWELYGKGSVLEAADRRLNGEFDGSEMERLMVVGLWCAHPDCKLRPSIQEATRVLRAEKPLPELPSTRPRPVYQHLQVTDAIVSTALSLMTASSSSIGTADSTELRIFVETTIPPVISSPDPSP